MDIKKIFNKKGFTLTEIMLTMIIIGVISVVTLPTMINSIQTRQYKSGVKKAHTIVSESFDSMKVDENYIYKMYNNDNVAATAFRNIYAKYFGFVNRQGEVVSDVLKTPEDFKEMYYPLNDTTTNIDEALYSGGGFQTRNGMMVMIGKVPKPYDTSSNALIISIDIDGAKKGENQLGRDVFSFEVMPSDNILPVGAKSTEENTTSFDYQTYCQTDTTGGNNLNGIACTYSAINKAEYMETLSDRNGGQNCEGKWVKDVDGGICQCSRGKKWNKIEKKCECPSNYIIGDDGRCHKASDDKCILRAAGGDACCKYDCENQSFNDKKEEWECNNGTLVGEHCSGCSAGQADLSDGTCCPGEKIDDNTCECTSGKEWVVATKKCESECLSDFERDASDGQCKCKDAANQTAINGNSVCCPNNKTVGGKSLSLTTQESGSKCIYDCIQGNYDADKGICLCDSDSTWSDGVCDCTTKKPHSKWTEENGKGGCVCDSGRAEQGGQCICNNLSTADDCGCEAEKGFVARRTSATSPEKCECDTTKGFKAQVGGSICRCASSLRKIENGVCVCNSELHRVNVNGECKCDSENHWVENGNTCSCDTKNGFVEKDGTCVCIAGEFVNGKCETQCINGATYDSSTKKCVCNVSGATLSGNECVCEGQLVIIQGKDLSSSCGCAGGKIKSGTSCISSGGNCSTITGKYYDSQANACLCADGLVEDKSNGSCSCPGGWIQNLEMGTTKVEDGEASYTRMYCHPIDFCLCEDCEWLSLGGSNGSCNCGEGLTYNSSSKTCSCNGVDVTTKNTETNLTGVYSCECNSSKLTYQYKDSEKTYACSPSGDYYEISSNDELKEAVPLMGTYNFKLTSDVSVSDDWTPWGTVDKPFNGTFDGDGKTITINNDFGSSEDDYVGMFGYTGPNCKITNLNVVIKGSITGKNYVGALVGYNNCEIKNVTVTGSDTSDVTGEEGVGGLIGYNKGSVKYAFVDNFNIKGNKYFGGFVGINSSSVMQSKAGSKIRVGTEEKPGTYAGGFVGKMDDYSVVMNSATECPKVYSGVYAGGFVGEFKQGSITYVYTLAEADANTAQDNFVGYYDKTKSKDIYVLNSFFVDNTHLVLHENMDTLYGRSLAELKNSVTYLCAYWNQTPCIWAFDASQEKYPQILSESAQVVCEDYNCKYKDKKYFSTDNTCAEYDITSVDSADCPAVLAMCKSDEHLDSEGNCIKCASRQYWDSTEKLCKCDDTQIWNEPLKNCVCKDSSTSVYYEGAGCIDCTANGDATKSGDKCVCNNSKKTYDYDLRKCVGKCDQYDGTYDDVLDTCVLASSLTYDKVNDKVSCVDSTSIDISNDADLYYMSRCTYAGDIDGGGIDWSEGKTFTLTSDIDMDAAKVDKGYTGTFKPIYNFQGIFAGDDKTIKNLTIKLASQDYVGLFNLITSDAQITDLYLNNFNIKGRNYVGALAGTAYIKNDGLNKVFVNNTVLEGNNYVGGLIGSLEPSYESGIGKQYATISYVAAITKIKANENQGGLFGYLSAGDAKKVLLQKAYALSRFDSVNAGTTGGLIGKVSSNITLASANGTNEKLLTPWQSYYYANGVPNAVGTESTGTITYLRTGNITTDSCPANMTLGSIYTCSTGTTYPYFTDGFMTAADTDVSTVNTFICGAFICGI